MATTTARRALRHCQQWSYLSLQLHSACDPAPPIPQWCPKHSRRIFSNTGLWHRRDRGLGLCHGPCLGARGAHGAGSSEAMRAERSAPPPALPLFLPAIRWKPTECDLVWRTKSSGSALALVGPTALSTCNTTTEILRYAATCSPL